MCIPTVIHNDSLWTWEPCRGGVSGIFGNSGAFYGKKRHHFPDPCRPAGYFVRLRSISAHVDLLRSAPIALPSSSAAGLKGPGPAMSVCTPRKGKKGKGVRKGMMIIPFDPCGPFVAGAGVTAGGALAGGGAVRKRVARAIGGAETVACSRCGFPFVFRWLRLRRRAGSGRTGMGLVKTG
jgi:hypothetical protein